MILITFTMIIITFSMILIEHTKIILTIIYLLLLGMEEERCFAAFVHDESPET